MYKVYVHTVQDNDLNVIKHYQRYSCRGPASHWVDNSGLSLAIRGKETSVK